MTVVRYGRGSVIGPDASHTTWGIVRDYYNAQGVRKQPKQRGFATRREAEMALDEWRVAVNKRMAVEPSRMSLAELFEQWMESEVAGLRPKTIESYHYSSNHVIKRIGGKSAQALTPQDVNALKVVLMRETGPRVAYKAMQCLRQALSWATQIEFVQRNVAALVDLPSYQADEGIALSHAQARAFLAVAEDATYSPLWLLYLSTGVRRGEGLGLQWKDWKPNVGLLSIRQQASIIKGQDGKARIVLAEVKSRAGRRTVEVDARLALALEEHLARQRRQREGMQPWVDHDLIFCTGNGLVLNPNNVLRVFYQLRDLSHLPPDLTIHDLRHTHASHLVLAGVPILEVSRRLGHARPDITLQKYSHLMPGYVGSATAAVESALYPSAVPLHE
jgi:integrase